MSDTRRATPSPAFDKATALVDGAVESGESAVDEAMLTGESRPVTKSVGATAIGLLLSLTRGGDDSVLLLDSGCLCCTLRGDRDWITIGEELERTRSYLTIQKMRYRDILDFKIEAESDVLENTILKLILQPLVENALYHGIKNKRQGGIIIVRAYRKGSDEVQLEVEDNGIGFTSEKLAQLRAELEDESGDIHAFTRALADHARARGAGCAAARLRPGSASSARCAVPA